MFIKGHTYNVLSYKDDLSSSQGQSIQVYGKAELVLTKTI
jgi:hypothetical protein